MAISFDDFAVYTFYYIHNNFETMVNSLKKNGIHNVELYANAPHLCEMYEYTKEEKADILANIKKKLNDAEIKLSCIFVPLGDCPTNLASENGEVNEFSVNYVLRFLEDAKFLGAKGILIDAGTGVLDHNAEEAWMRSERSLKRIVEAAEKLGVNVYLVPSLNGSNVVYDLPSLTKMIYSIGSGNLYACADASVISFNKESIADYFRIFGDKVGHVRIGNYTAAGELIEGNGKKMLAQYIDVMNCYHYQGAITIDINWDHLDSTDYASRKFVETFSKI